MNIKIKKIFTNVRVIILLVFLILAVFAISPKPWAEGVGIRNVISNSSATEAGIVQPLLTTKPVDRERILEIDNRPVKKVEDYYNYINALELNQSVQIKTNEGLYRIRTREKFEVIELNETVKKRIDETITVNETINGVIVEKNKTISKTIEVPKTKQISKGTEDIGLMVFNTPKTNIRKGLDLQGGTRVLLQPEELLSARDMASLIDTMEERLNVYGLSDLIIRDATDLTGNQYILVEIAGANEEEIRNLLAKQGKFEAKIANKTVFIGGKDIVFVCRSADCAGIDPSVGCFSSQGQEVCGFRFSISITPEAAQKFADATKDLAVIEDNGKYLSEPLELYLDDTKVKELNIVADLKGRAETDIQITGSGAGFTQQEAAINSMNNMKRLQTILITGSLPVKLNIVKVDTISPLLGKEFLKNAMIVGLVALISVGIVIFIRYRKLRVVVPAVLISMSEIIILLGVAALIGWNIDLAAVAGIIIAVGIGVDHQIVIADETLRGEKGAYDWKQRIKNAFFIIMASYFTVFVAMMPLVFAGAGLLKGFAITTILGASIGVFISRPVFARVIEILLRE
jgi:preprotein translocase subunit SecD|tara:strand:+ start:21745 stop:23463 length:1719 start_codon:yes stop_codon:yes gene_type:complete